MIFNKTRKRKLAEKAVICKSVFSKFLGLMFSKKLKDKGLVFVFKKNVKLELHMLFVFYAIDVLFLDENRRVVEMKEDFRPFTFYFPKKRFRYVIELPAGIIGKTRTRIGDLVSFK